jgi:hypothetical protein
MTYNKIEKYILNKLKKKIHLDIYKSINLKRENFIRDVINSIRSETEKDNDRFIKINNYIKYHNKKVIKNNNNYFEENNIILKLKWFFKIELFFENFFAEKISFFKLYLFIREYPIYKNYNILKIILFIFSLNMFIIAEIINHYYFPFNINFIDIKTIDIYNFLKKK